MSMTKEQLAKAAARVLNDPGFDAAIDFLRTDYLAAWEKTAALETSQREAVYHRINALSDVKLALRRLADAPKVDAYNHRHPVKN